MGKMTHKDYTALLTVMMRIRMFEEAIIALYPQQEMKTPVHLYLGEEAIAAGVCRNLIVSDYIFSNHRNHGHCIAKGMSFKDIMAELYGKASGCSHGKGGSMHLVDPQRGIMGTSAIVGGGFPLAVGTALASVMQKKKQVSVVFFGDGAVDTGTFHESLNFASVKRLPVVFVCENNFYATNSPLLARHPADNIFERAKPYRIKSVRVDGNDVCAVFKASQKAVSQARMGKGPWLIECRTYRYRGHVGPNCDYESGCRPKEELQVWLKRCPVERFKRLVFKKKIMTSVAFERLKSSIDAEIQEAVAYGKSSPYPGQEQLMEGIY